VVPNAGPKAEQPARQSAPLTMRLRVLTETFNWVAPAR